MTKKKQHQLRKLQRKQVQSEQHRKRMKIQHQKYLKRKQKESFTQRHPAIGGWILFICLVIIIIVLLTMNDKYSSPGFYGHLSIPGRFLIANFGPYVGGYGIAIIVLTAIVRLLLMPSMVKRQENGIRNQIGMKVFRPEIKKIRLAYHNATTKQEKRKQSRRLMVLYKEHNLGLGNMGCGAIIIQIPIFGMLYAAIRFSPEIKRAYLWGVKLGKPSMLIAAFSFLAYIINALITKYSIKKQNAKNKKKPKNAQQAANRRKSMMFVNIMVFSMPLWIGFISTAVSAGLALYFCVGGLFVIGQQLYVIHKTPAIQKDEKRRVAEANR